MAEKSLYMRSAVAELLLSRYLLYDCCMFPVEITLSGVGCRMFPVIIVLLGVDCCSAPVGSPRRTVALALDMIEMIVTLRGMGLLKLAGIRRGPSLTV